MAKTFLNLQNLRGSKINETSADKILDADLARFYNEVTADMSQAGQTLKHVTTNLIANQANYGESVLPGFTSSAQVKVNGKIAPYISIDSYSYEYDRARQCHTVVNNEIYLLPTPTISTTAALDVFYWAKLPEIIDAAVDSTPLTDLAEKYWYVVEAGITLKMYEKLLIISTVSIEDIPQGSLDSLLRVVSYFQKKYTAALDSYASQSSLFHKPNSSKGTASRENELPIGYGRQTK